MERTTHNDLRKSSLHHTFQLCIGLTAINLIILQSILSLASLDTLRFVSLAAFSVSIPLLASLLTYFHYVLQMGESNTKIDDAADYVTMVDGLITVIGIVADIWYFSWILSVIFMAVSICLFIFLAWSLGSLTSTD